MRKVLEPSTGGVAAYKRALVLSRQIMDLVRKNVPEDTPAIELIAALATCLGATMGELQYTDTRASLVLTIVQTNFHQARTEKLEEILGLKKSSDEEGAPQ
jgi:hypothetical protein